jgi:hypothetical protein
MKLQLNFPIASIIAIKTRNIDIMLHIQQLRMQSDSLHSAVILLIKHNILWLFWYNGKENSIF